MGLDQFAYKVKFDKKGDNLEKSIYHLVSDGCYSLEQVEGVLDIEEIQYWRKNRFIHNWIEENVYFPKAKEVSDKIKEFDTVYVKLNESDLEQLKQDILSDKIKDYNMQGFFFGSQDYNEKMKEEDLKFVENALKAIKEGDEIYYYSWW